MRLNDLTHSQLIALVRQAAEALEACEAEAMLRAALTHRTHTNDRMHIERDLRMAASRAARERKAVLAKARAS